MAPRSNPRRRPSPQKPLSNDVSPPITVKSLQKGATFHAPTSPISEVDDPVFHVPALPQRTSTCLGLCENKDKTLRVAEWIRSLDRPYVQPEVGPSEQLEQRRDSDLPLPASLLDALDSTSDVITVTTTANTANEPDDPNGADRASRGRRRPGRPRKHQRQVSDSGIGSSVSGTADDAGTESRALERPLTAITGTISLMPSSAIGGPTALSPYAARRIQKLIVEPILKRAALSDFHSLVHDIPRRIDAKELLCLRDLEKTLIWSAPTSAKSPHSYLLFCETSIQCLHTAVSHIGEHEHRRPTDAPYTNGYFVDLVGQVREYARMMAASRQRRETGKVVEGADEADHSPTEEIKLDGGLSQTGRPAQLVRVKDGKTLPIPGPSSATTQGRPYDGRSVVSKRSLDEDEDDEEEDVALRSMARRRKLAPGETMSAPVLRTCPECKKQFKRPCDLTKHEKTHSRPWKCMEPTCKYHSYGWPTEKERDRHYNDKHSASPAMYRCKFPPCTYRSKRESNCKQHMEKSHGWVYKRAKGNGKKTGANPPETPSTSHEMATPASSSFEDQASVTPEEPAPSHTSLFGANNGTTFDHLTSGQINLTMPHDQTDWSNIWDAQSDVGSHHLGSGQLETTISPSAPVAASAFPADAWTGLTLPADQSLQFDVGATDWTALNHLETGPAQLLTPQRSVERRAYGSFGNDHQQDLDFLLGAAGGHMLNTSPLPPTTQQPTSNGQAQMTLGSPSSAEHLFEDETFGDYIPQPGTSTMDFRLFDSNNGPTYSDGEATSMTQSFFPELTPFDQPLHLSSSQLPPPAQPSQQPLGGSHATGLRGHDNGQGHTQGLTTPPVDFLADFMETDA